MPRLRQWATRTPHELTAGSVASLGELNLCGPFQAFIAHERYFSDIVLDR